MPPTFDDGPREREDPQDGRRERTSEVRSTSAFGEPVAGEVAAVGDARDAAAEAHQVREFVRASETLGAVLHACPAAVVLLDLDGTVRTWNPAAEHILGWRAGEVLGSRLPAAGPAQQTFFDAELARVAGGEVLEGVEMRLPRRGGELDARVWSAPVQRSDGTLQCLAIIADASERRRLERLRALLADAGRYVSESLEREPTLERIVRLPVPEHATWCLLDVLADDAPRIERVATAGRAHAESHPRARRPRVWLEADAALGVGVTLASGQLRRYASVDDALLRALTADAAELTAARALGLRSAVCAPVTAGGRTIGCLTLAAAHRDLDATDAWLAQELARSAACVIERATLLTAERRARVRVTRLQEVTAALSRATTAEEVAAAACRIGSEAMEADSGALWLRRDDGALLLAGTWGSPREFMERFRVISPDAASVPALEVVRTGAPRWIETEADYRAASPAIFEVARAAGRVASYGAVPLARDGRPAGVIVFAHPIGHRYDPDERAFYAALAQHCEQALDRARLLDAERRSNARLRVLAAVGDALARSLDERGSLQAIARLIVPALADGCGLYLLDGARLERVAGAHRARPGAAAPQHGPRALEAVAVDDGHPIARVARTGEPWLLPRFDADPAGPRAREALERELLAGERGASGIVVPLSAGAETVGALALVTGDPAAVYDDDDLALALDLGRRAGLAVANARLFAREQEAARRAEEASRAKDEFLATVSHELRTPLNAILGWATLLGERRQDPGALARGLAVIKRNAEAQSRVVNDVLDVARVITGRLKIDARPADLVAVVRAALDVVRPSADARGIALELATPPQGTAWLVGDAERLQQVAWNLLSNAVKFTEAGGHVLARVEQAAERVVLTITDTGAGIDPAFLPRVFERFQQADGSTTRRHGGLGLGLAVVRHIVELHGGWASAESAGVGRGAEFRVVLPTRAPRHASADAPTPTTTGPRPVVRRRPGDLRGLRVLVVEDEPDMRELLETALREAGAAVESADSARTALKILEGSTPEMLVSDIGMPGEDGYALIRAVRARGLPVRAVALTAYARDEDRRRALAEGFDAHVAKPVDTDDLSALLAELRAPSASGARS